MKQIVILSDTHGLIRDEVKACLAKADVMIHAGDINNLTVADTLRSYTETYMVRGNNDKEWADDLPESLRFTIEGIRFFLTHNKKNVPKGISDVDVVVYGHSHKYHMEEQDGVLWLNPGSCGKRRFDQEITFCIMEAQQGQFQVEKILLFQKR